MWMVPLSFCKKSKPTEECYSTILSDKKAKITIPDVAPDEWIKLNPGTVGFYRTKYPTELLQQFVPSIEDKSLPPLDRLGLVDDLFALVSDVTSVCLHFEYVFILNPFNFRFKPAKQVPSTVWNCYKP